ncbi:alpha/beta fold hydrolase [Actinomadura namibiensis]|uniref:alpha/beta fold hydrolase n=1 Tax=Actinomadura kijaniata TaxID=46161 RepID=UPI0024843E63
MPGFGATADQLGALARRLGGFRVLVFDLPGHGRSAGVPTDGRLPALAATLHDAIDEAGARAYHLVGVVP